MTTTEDGVPAVQVRGRADGDEELRTVGARPGVGHRQQVRTVELQLGVELVLEPVARAATAGAGRSPPWIMKPSMTRWNTEPS